jgi:predicted nucleic-acid-binding protein
VIALDTNALLRYLVDDEQAPAQCSLVREDVSAALHAGETVFLPTVALVESVWVLTRRLKVSRADVIAVLRDFIAVPGVTLEGPGTISRALAAWEKGPAGFADYVQLDVAMGAGATHLVTFDEDLQKSTGTRAPGKR